MTEMRSYIKREGTLYLLCTGNVAKNLFETVIFAVNQQNRKSVNEIHREYHDRQKDAILRHLEYLNDLQEVN